MCQHTDSLETLSEPQQSSQYSNQAIWTVWGSNPSIGKRFFPYPKHAHQPPIQWAPEAFPGGKVARV